jgi:hypothetical protein
LIIFLLSLIVFGLALFAIFVPSTLAAEPQPTGSFNIWYYNYIDEGGASCPSTGAMAGGSETDINHFWREGTSPFAGVNVDNYMVCWDGTLNFPMNGRWTVHTINDDGMDVYLNGHITMHGWYDQGPSLHDGTIAVSAGANQVIVKYYNRALGGTACVAWGAENKPIPWWRCPSNQPAPPAPPPPKVVCCKYPLYKPQCFWWYSCYTPIYSCYYRVVWGDTLTAIALRYRTTIWWLMQVNGLYNPNFIYVGMVLRVC